MPNSKVILEKATKIVAEVGSRNPVDIAEHLGIKIYYANDYVDLLGMYVNVKQTRGIFINSNLEEYMFRMVLAHEIGHDTLHRDYAKNNVLQEFTLFNIKDNKEAEANAFAAHILLDSNDIYESAKEGLDIVSIAQMNCVNVNLVAIKVCEMISSGYELSLPIDINRNFLKDIKI